jgi:hypothetical protein
MMTCPGSANGGRGHSAIELPVNASRMKPRVTSISGTLSGARWLRAGTNTVSTGTVTPRPSSSTSLTHSSSGRARMAAGSVEQASIAAATMKIPRKAWSTWEPLQMGPPGEASRGMLTRASTIITSTAIT